MARLGFSWEPPEGVEYTGHEKSLSKNGSTNGISIINYDISCNVIKWS